MLSFVFLSQPLPSTVSSSASFLSLFTQSSAPTLDSQPISLLLQTLQGLFLFARDNTVVVFLLLLLTSTVLWLLGFNLLIPPHLLTSFLRSTLGLSGQRTKRAIVELKRKSFHLLGLLIPVIYYMGSKYTVWLDQHRAVLIMAACTGVVWVVEVLRLWWPAFRRGYSRTFAPLMRKKEMSEENVRLTGVAYFFLGNLLCVFLFEPTIATCASRQHCHNPLAAITISCMRKATELIVLSVSVCVLLVVQCTWCLAT